MIDAENLKTFSISSETSAVNAAPTMPKVTAGVVDIVKAVLDLEIGVYACCGSR